MTCKTNKYAYKKKQRLFEFLAETARAFIEIVPILFRLVVHSLHGHLNESHMGSGKIGSRSITD